MFTSSALMSRRYVVLDVFTTRRFAGNPLAVVLDSKGLDDATMQAIAREFALSETVFVLPPADPAHRAALRIFTPERELPFAGHPTVGAAVLLGLRDAAAGTPSGYMVLEERVGPVHCKVHPAGATTGEAIFRLPRLPAEVGAASSTAMLAGALGLDRREIGFGNHVPSVYSAGLGFTFVPVTSLEAMRRIRLETSLWVSAVRPRENPNAYAYCRQTEESGHQFHARMFAPAMGIDEDAATGSAVAAFAGVLMRFEKPGDGTHRFIIEQGYEMGRPSQITLDLHVEGGALGKACIGGDAVIVSEGVLL
jgi:trans-2,3-dihydro-3-hydroxyanthranilate isomerase